MSAAVVPRQVDAQARGMVVGGLLLAPRPAMPGLDVAKFATQVVAGFLQRITFAPFQPGISEPVGDLVQLILDIAHALVEAAPVAADFAIGQAACRERACQYV